MQELTKAVSTYVHIFNITYKVAGVLRDSKTIQIHLKCYTENKQNHQ